MAGFAPDLAQIANAIPAQQAPTTGASTSITNPTSPFDDLQNKADAIRQQQVMQDLQNRAAAITPPTQPGQLSQDNPYASMVADYSARVKQSAPDSTPKHGVKGFLSNFFQGAGDAMLTHVGMPTPYQQRQTDLQNFERISQIASQWEAQKQELAYRQALLGQLEDNRKFQSQIQPLQLQHEQLANQALQNQVTEQTTTIHPSLTAQELTAMALPTDVANQFAGKPLTSADMQALFQISAHSALRPADYGQDGTGPGKGIWLVDAGGNPVRQWSPISETARSTSLAKFQQQLQLQAGTARSARNRHRRRPVGSKSGFPAFTELRNDPERC